MTRCVCINRFTHDSAFFSLTAVATYRKRRVCAVRPLASFKDACSAATTLHVCASSRSIIRLLQFPLCTQDPDFIFSVVSDVFFITDVILNFFTGYVDENDVLVTDQCVSRYPLSQLPRRGTNACGLPSDHPA